MKWIIIIFFTLFSTYSYAGFVEISDAEHIKHCKKVLSNESSSPKAMVEACEKKFFNYQKTLELAVSVKMTIAEKPISYGNKRLKQ